MTSGNFSLKRFARRIVHHANQPVTIHSGVPRFKEWRAALKETINVINDKNLPILAAGVAYFSTLAFFPMLVVLVSLTAFFIQPTQLGPIIENVNRFLPPDIAGLITAQLQTLAGRPETTLFATALALLVALYGIMGAFDNIIKAMNVAFGLKETRSFFHVKRVSLFFSLGAILFLLIVVPVMAVTAEWLVGLGIPAMLAALIIVLRWPLLAILIMTALSLLYSFGPDHHLRKWHWRSWGSIIATILWMLVTVLFFVYARYFGHFSSSYSLFAGIIVLMIWLNLSAMVFLIGADINARIIQYNKR